jgi:hypothetical protein
MGRVETSRPEARLLALIAMLLASPFPAASCGWWSKAEHRCRDADVE